MKGVDSTTVDSDEFLRLLSEQMFLGLLIIQDNQVKYANKAISNIFGDSSDEISNWDVLESLNLISQDNREFVKDQLQKKQAGQEDVTNSYALQIDTPKGIKHIRIHSKTIIYEGKPADLISLMDITEQTKALTEVKEREEKYRLLFNNTNDSIFMFQIDKDGKMLNFVEVNDATCKWLGFSGEELLQLSPISLIPEENKENVNETIQYIIKNGYLTYEMEIMLRDQKKLPVEMSSSLFTDGENRYILSSAREIADRVVARDERVKQIEEKTLLLDLITHDLRNYIVRLWGFGNEITSNEDITLVDAKINTYKSRATLAQLENLINNVSVLMKRELDVEYLLREINLLQSINICKADLQELFPAKHFVFNITNIDISRFVMADSLFDQLIINIFTNAAKNDSAEKIIIDIILEETKDSKYQLTISDHGKGIKLEDREDIFNRYSEFRKIGEGSGLGLFIIKTLVERYQGKIIIASRDEKDYTKGTSFVLELEKAN